MKIQSVLTLGSSVMLWATIVQADHFVIVNAASSRSNAYLYDDAGKVVAENWPRGGGGELSVGKVIKDNMDDNTIYLKNLLYPFPEFLSSEEKPTKVFFYGTGGTENLDEESEQAVWDNIKKVFDNVDWFKSKFVLQEAKSLPAEEVTKLDFKIAKKLSTTKKTMSIAFHGLSIAVANGFQFPSLKDAGIVAASAIHVNRLWTNESERNDYETKAKAMVDASKEQYDECRKDNAQELCLAMQKQGDFAALKEAVSEGGELENYFQKISNPCLPKEENPMDTINGFMVKKSLETTLRELVPFKGTGNFDECFAYAASQIEDQGFVMPRVHKQPFSVIALGGIHHYETNLKKIGIETNAVDVIKKDGEKKGRKWTLEQIKEAAKEVCGQSYTTLYDEYVVKQKTLSGHLLAESCWATTYIYAILEKVGLTEKQPILLSDKDWEDEKAQEIVKKYYPFWKSMNCATCAIL